ncbi:unnamed protein product [Dimorphilus gyrociliatus]|uniref:Uncharacterized protein n=1 Tax=Dimorphilus gyrociliatus TaxID=2664684 RepID=A0A7I8VVW0_9ANNE|nr:unnamed protein product [Dimorphilus gyrociliatus]
MELYAAVQKGDNNKVEGLLMKGADANAVFDDEPVLFTAVANREELIIKLLLDHNADPNRPFAADEGFGVMMRYPLHEAICRNEKEIDVCCRIVCQLLSKGADPDAVDDCGQTAFHHAAACNNLQIIKLLLQYKANPLLVDASGDTALSLSASEGHYEITKLLLENGVNPNSPSSAKNALCTPHSAIIQLLLEHKANPNGYVSEDDSNTTVVESFCRLGKVDILTKLVQHGGKLTQRCGVLAVNKASPSLLHFLLENGVKFGFETLDAIYKQANAKALLSLYLIGIDPKIDDTKMRYLQVLSLNFPTIKVVRMLETMKSLNMEEPSVSCILKLKDNPLSLARTKDVCEYFLTNLGNPMALKGLCRIKLYEVLGKDVFYLKFPNSPEVERFLRFEEAMAIGEKCLACDEWIDECSCGEFEDYNEI